LDLAGQRVLVVGLARSGVAAARFLVGRGARVVATDRKKEEEFEPEALSLPAAVRRELGGHVRASFTGADLIVVSPGVPWDMAELEEARAAGVPVIAELELAYRFLQGRVVAVTGTKGKSTTTAAIGAMLTEHGYDTRVGGNIGRPAITMVEGATEASVFVLEVSSFQLEGIDRFHADVAVFLNLSPDHLDRHPDFEAYAQAKARVFRNQDEQDWAVVNADDAQVTRLASSTRARMLRFGAGARTGGSNVPPADGAFFEAGEARLVREGVTETLFRRDTVRLPGAHLADDLLAAAAAARLMGAAPEAIARAVATFTGAEHVLEEVAVVDGVAYYNDSKATNIAAAQKSLESFDRPVLVILGGRHKGGDFADLTAAVTRHVTRVLAIGEAQDTIERALGHVKPVQRCGSLEEAVHEGARQAVAGDVVLLAPACSSFDMFKDYADRGHAFKSAVAALAGKGRP
jgi:UDP-N-acetylmuramoylalanine--D-glutamate ligase